MNLSGVPFFQPGERLAAAVRIDGCMVGPSGSTVQ